MTSELNRRTLKIKEVYIFFFFLQLSLPDIFPLPSFQGFFKANNIHHFPPGGFRCPFEQLINCNFCQVNERTVAMSLIKHAHMYPLMSSKPAVPHLLSGASPPLYPPSIEGDLPECIGLNIWGVTDWMIKKKREREREGKLRDTQTSTLISALKSASQVSSVWEISFEKRLARDGKREWLIGTLERLWARNNVPRINKPLTSQTGSLKCCVWKSFSHLFIFKIRRASLSSAWKACVSGMCIVADSLPPYAPSTYSILSCFLRADRSAAASV